MKRKILPMLGLMAAMTLVACGGKTSTEPAKSTAKSTPAATSKATSKSSAAPQSKEPTPVAEWVADGAKNGSVNPEKWGTDATKKAYRLDITDATGWNTSESKMNAKSGENSMSTWTVAGIPNGKYEIDMSVKMTNAGHSSRYWFNHALNGKDDSGNPPDNDGESAFRYFFKLNSTGSEINPTVTETWGEQGLSADEFKAVTVVAEVTVTDLTSFQLIHGNIGYSLFVEYVRLIAK